MDTPKQSKQEKTRYWLKLEKNFLDSKYIKVIKNMPNGKEYILFYLALMLESIDSVGHLKFTDLVPYNEEMLSSLTDTNIDVVRSAMKLLIDLGMVTILNDGTIFLPEVPRLTGKESESAERVRAFRARKKQFELQCNADVTNSNDNIDKQSITYNEQSTENKEKQEDSESMKQARSLSQFLFDECRRIDEKFGIGKDRVTVERWTKDIEKLIRIDKRTFYEVKEVIAWAKSHNFWTANIMSGVKLREQFPRLYTQMRKEKQDEEKKRPKTREEIYAEMVARYGESQ